MELKPNSSLKNGKYKIVKTLGNGGFGITYLAMSKEKVQGAIGGYDVEVPIAIKEFYIKEDCSRANDSKTVILPTTDAAERIKRYRNKFIKEAHNISEMNHPNIVHVSDVFEENNTVYYCMQYLKGGSLSDVVKRNGKPLQEEQAVKYVLQIADALQYMHSKNICHLDVKPGNIMLDDKDNAVLIDFGISKKYDTKGEESTNTPTGVSDGFAPIEQYHGMLHDFSPSTDVYSLGATLLYLIRGTIPPNAEQVLNKGIGDRPANISNVVWNTILKAMNPIRRDRFQNMSDFINSLNTPTDETIENTDIEGDGETIALDVDDNNIGEEETYIIEDDKPEDDNENYVTQEKSTGQKSLFLKMGIVALLTALVVVGGWTFYNKRQNAILNVTDHRLTDGSVFTGTLKNGVPQGKGKIVYSDGRIYEGSFEKGLRVDSAAHFVYSNKNVFDGVFAGDTIQSGRASSPSGDVYFVGTFSSGCPYNGYWYESASKSKILKVEKGKEIQL